MVALHHQQCVGEQRVDERRVPHQVPAFLRRRLEALQLLARHDKAVVGAEGLEVGHVAVQHFPQRVPVQEADVIALVEGVDEDLPIHGLRDHALVVERPGSEFVGRKLGPEAAEPRIDIEGGRAVGGRGRDHPDEAVLLAQRQFDQ